MTEFSKTSVNCNCN